MDEAHVHHRSHFKRLQDQYLKTIDYLEQENGDCQIQLDEISREKDGRQSL